MEDMSRSCDESHKLAVLVLLSSRCASVIKKSLLYVVPIVTDVCDRGDRPANLTFPFVTGNHGYCGDQVFWED